MNWLKRIFSGKSGEMTAIPEIIGRVVDEDGREQPLRRGPLQHDSLTPEQTARVARLREVLAEAYPMTLDGWIDGFLRDAHPEREIQIIEAVAVVYRQLTEGRDFSVEEKQRLYGILCTLTAMGESPELQASLPAGKGLPELAEIWELYERAWRGGERP
jgi:hypothetical protein